MNNKARAYTKLSDPIYGSVSERTTINGYEKVDDTPDIYGLYAVVYIKVELTILKRISI